jgi:hypothetical protein
MFGGQHILVGEGAPRLSWIDAMDADERYEAEEEGRLPQDGARSEADSPQTYAQVAEKAVGRRKRKVPSHNEGKTSE